MNDLLEKVKTYRWWSILKALAFEGGPSSTKWVYLAMNGVLAAIPTALTAVICWVYVRSADHHVDTGLLTALVTIVGIISTCAVTALNYRRKVNAQVQTGDTPIGSTPNPISGEEKPQQGSTGAVAISVLLLSLLAFTLPSHAQFVNVTANSCIGSSDGALLAKGIFEVQLTDGADNPIFVRVGGFQGMSQPVHRNVVAGTIVAALQLPNPSSTSPASFYVRATITDSATNKVTTYRKISVIPDDLENWDFCAADKNQNFAGLPFIPTPGPMGPPGCVVGSSCDTVVTTTPSGSQVITQPTGTTYAVVQGTSSVPATGLSFNTPTESKAVVDNSAQTSNSSSQGNPFFAPARKHIVVERGGADAVTSYEELQCAAGSTGDCYAPFTIATAQPGSRPPQIAHNRLLVANNFFPVSSCSTASGVTTCNLVVPSFGVIGNPFMVGDNIYISGVGAPYDTTASPFVWVISAVTTNTVKFSGVSGNVSATGSCDTSNVIACPRMALASDIFGYEDEVVNNSHDPGSELDNPRIRQSHTRVRGHLVTCAVGKYRCSHGILVDPWNYFGVDVQDSVDADFYAGNLPALFADPTTPLHTKHGYLAGARLADPNAGTSGHGSNDSLNMDWEYYRSLGFASEQHFFGCKAKGQGFNVLARLVCYHDGTEVFSVGPDGSFSASSLTLSGVHVPTVSSGTIFTTSSTAETVPVPNFPGTGQCAVTALSGTSAASPFWISAKAAGQVTLNHAASAGLGYDVVCVTP